jgi:signal transduction histidine kinase/class 3 adenylate cyclase/ActR/RegA family two-component response regulator
MLESMFYDAVIKGLFYGLNFAISFFLIYRYVQSRKSVLLNAGIFVLLVASFLAIIDLGVFSTYSVYTTAGSYKFIIFITSAVSFQLLMVLKNLTRAFENNGITDTYLAMCFGLTVFSTIVGPFLSTNVAIAASIVLLLFIGLFASGFSLFVLKGEKAENLPIVSTMILTVIATALGLLYFLDISFSDVYQRLGMHAIVSLSVLGMTYLLLEKEPAVLPSEESTDSISSSGSRNPESIARLMANDRVKDEHISMVAHELRTPLGGIIGISELLMEGAEGELPASVNLNLKLVADSGRRLTYLLNDLLDLSKIRYDALQISKSPIHLRSLVSKVMALQYSVASQKGVELRNSIPSDFVNVMADEGKLEQILHNLIGNSVKFTDEGYIAIEVEQLGDKVTIMIEDTGKGLSQTNLQSILESFNGEIVQAGNAGHNSGLGLKISNKLIELHGSRLTMESAEGFGSFFSFQLDSTTEDAPINEEYENYSIAPRVLNQSLTHIRPHRNARLGERFRVMVIDDEIINVKVLTAQLGKAGYEVTAFYNGPSALQALNEGYLPDVILLDIMMPQMNGYEVCIEVRKEFNKVELPVIMLTAKNHVSDIVEAFKVGASDYVAKPIAKDELLARIKTHLELSKINHAFSRFVPHEFLGFLGYESVLDIKLGDQVQQNMTVLFADIKDFTRLSENLSPKEAFDFINTFLGVVSPLIRQHGGFIDKFIGDAIMALFPGGADDAVRTAVSMTTELKKLNKHRLEQGLEPIYTGTGIHTGDLMLGIIGEELRMEGTVISDVVNTASRLEGLTKLFDNRIIISSQVRESLKEVEGIHFRYLGKTRVKGKNSVLDVFGILEGDDDERVKLELDTIDSFENGLREFYNKNFTNASVLFNDVLKLNPKDRAASIFLKRSAQLMINGAPKDWSGVDESIHMLEDQS